MKYTINSANSHPNMRDVRLVVYVCLAIKSSQFFYDQKKINPAIPNNTFNIPAGSKL